MLARENRAMDHMRYPVSWRTGTAIRNDPNAVNGDCINEHLHKRLTHQVGMRHDSSEEILLLS